MKRKWMIWVENDKVSIIWTALYRIPRSSCVKSCIYYDYDTIIGLF